MTEQTISIERMDEVISIFGSFDENMRVVEDELQVHVNTRDNELKITGEAENVMLAVRTINGLLSLNSERRSPFAANRKVRDRACARRQEKELDGVARDVLCVTARGKPIKPKTVGQKKYVDAILNNTITIGVGPAGTGKTYLAVAAAVSAFRDKKVSRIILTRPAIEAGEKLGFLPGDLQSKVDPYLRPLYDALIEMFGSEGYAKNIERNNIEVAPLAYMRAARWTTPSSFGRSAEHDQGA